MANTKQQRKRVKIAERERTENLKYKSRIKTMFKTLTVAAQEDKERASQLAIELISLIDKAASRGVIHENNAARKKSRVSSMVELAEGTGKPKGPAAKAAKAKPKKAEEAPVAEAAAEEPVANNDSDAEEKPKKKSPAKKKEEKAEE
ncbi:MAG: 30S ribosomal protein S20 [Thermoleophilia bacterium]